MRMQRKWIEYLDMYSKEENEEKHPFRSLRKRKLAIGFCVMLSKLRGRNRTWRLVSFQTNLFARSSFPLSFLSPLLSLSLSISFLLPPSLFFSSNVMKQNNRQLALVAVLCFVSFTVISRWMTVSSSIPLAPTTSLLEAFSSHHKEVSSTPLRSLSWSEVMLIYYPVFFCRTSRGPVCIRGKELQRL